MNASISVTFKPSVSEALRKGSSNSVETRSVSQVVQRFGAKLRPMHPNLNHKDLNDQFVAEVDASSAEALSKALLELGEVAGSYVMQRPQIP